MNYSFLSDNRPVSSLPDRLSLSHPFTQQLDILFHPPNSTLEQILHKIDSNYYAGRIELSEILDACHQDLIGRFDDSHFDFVALAEGHLGVEDTWCIDHRGLLTLLLTKETYQQLGLVGEKASKKSGLHYVQVDLHDRTSTTYSRAKERIRLWDERRKSQGVPPWNVHIHGSLPSLQTKLRLVKVQARCTTLDDILVPVLDEKTKNEFAHIQRQSKSGNGAGGNEDEDEANERIEELFEWVGMACMCSGRLKANDSPNAFVAQYEAPQPCRPGSVTHVRWSGLLAPPFIKRVLETILESTKSAPSSGADNQDANPTNLAPTPRPSFLSVTANLYRTTPISYISPKAFGEGVKREVKMGRWDRKVECWSLLLKPTGSGSSVDQNGNGEGGESSESPGRARGEECEWVLACAES